MYWSSHSVVLVFCLCKDISSGGDLRSETLLIMKCSTVYRILCFCQPRFVDAICFSVRLSGVTSIVTKEKRNKCSTALCVTIIFNSCVIIAQEIHDLDVVNCSMKGQNIFFHLFLAFFSDASQNISQNLLLQDRVSQLSVCSLFLGFEDVYPPPHTHTRTHAL